MRLLIVCCVAGTAQIAASVGAAAMKPAPLSNETLMMLAQAKPGLQRQQQILREPDQQQITDDPRFEGLMRDPQMQRLMQNPQLQRQLQQNQQLRQMYQLQHRPLPGVSDDDDD